MAGHNKWSKIKRKKGVADAKRSKQFTKIIKEIMIAVKEGSSPDPDFNPRLRTAVQNAKGINMPKDNIERAIKKASETDAASFSEPTYEGYAPGGVAVFVEAQTDNLNRTVANIRAIFNKYNGNLATSGSVDFLFDRKALFLFDQADWEEDDLTLELIDAGAEDVDLDEGEVTVTTALEDFGNMQTKLDELKIDVKGANLERIPTTTVSLDKDTALKALRLIDMLEEDDDVKAVFHNIDITEEIAESIE